MNDINLKFIKDILMSSLDLEANILISPFDNLESIDHGIMKILWDDFDYNNISYLEFLYSSKENFLYFFENCLEQNHIFMRIPDKETTILVLGPFLKEDPTSVFLNRIIGRNKIPTSAIQAIKAHYSNVPVINERILTKTAQTIATYLLDDFNPDNIEYMRFDDTPISQSRPTSTLNFTMQIMEERYRIENKLIEAISQGDTYNALKYFESFPQKSIPIRVDNEVRNLKNTLFILNTLYRKGAEAGNVHPVYIDQLSTEFSIQIERTNNAIMLNNVSSVMTRKYCLLVKNYSLSMYSQIVRNTINYINLNLSTPLSLNILSINFGVNASYLSSQFKKETNRTLTDYIHNARIKAALPLLNTMDLSIQEISFIVGFEDYCYFSKLFKKIIGMSPLQYRNIIRKD